MMSWWCGMRRRAGGLVLVLAVGLGGGVTAGCTAGDLPVGSESPQPTGEPSPGPTTTSPNGGGSSGQGGPTRRTYTWQLPAGDTSPSGNEGSFYGNLMACEGAAEDLQREEWWSNFLSPRNVLLYMAAAHLCQGDVSGGEPYYTEAMEQYGTTGLGVDSRPCDVYRSVVSVLEQKARTDIPCPGGVPPAWRESGLGQKDNPLTFDIDESQPTASPTPTPAGDDSATPTPTGDDSTTPTGTPTS